ncbi:putative DNA repair protein [Methylophilaceae bacterium 11]|nr:putative DNA repair protein [Methylophilaceae bacterium 11]
MLAQAHSPLILCSTTRLARSLHLDYQRKQTESGTQQWAAPQIDTLTQWLHRYTGFALLAGEIDADYFSPNTLDSFTETMLWQQAIESCLAKHAFSELFDVPSLAQSAIAANQMLIHWQIEDAQLSDYFTSTETRQFLRWRNAFFKLCEQHQTVTPAWRLQQEIQALTQCQSPLPRHIQLIGFDRITPLEQRLMAILQSKGVTIDVRKLDIADAQLTQIGLPDLQAECRAAVAWAKHHLTQRPQSNLAIISPVQNEVRRVLSDLLDDTFHPEALHAHQYETPRIYDFSVGMMLSEHSMCRTALNLLRLASSHQALAQTDISPLLLDVYWSDLTELDARSLADARMRKKLMRTFHLTQLIALLEQSSDLPQCLAHLQWLHTTQTQWAKSQPPSVWSTRFAELLAHLHWAQTRPLSSHEYQAKQAWDAVLEAFAALDSLTGAISASDALQKLYQLARSKMFMPEAIGDVRIQLLGMLENLSQPIDAIWVMGMNDHLWPPPTDLNPLLPATLQRELLTPGASPNAQSVFAQAIHSRLCHSAHEVTFSWSHKAGERELRVSPLLANIPSVAHAPQANTMAENLAEPQTMQMLDDALAPPVHADNKLRGGTKLLAAQAVCPAWTFYQYRLGAMALEEPSDGLDSMTRGNLVHTVLQHFWLACGDLQTLKQLSHDALDSNIRHAVEKALQDIAQTLPKQLVRIEQNRLQQVLRAWLAIEIQREDFSVKACEAVYPIQVAGLAIECRIDRIDKLEDDALVIIDYKTGASDPKTSSWVKDRINEPQLPLYASIALKDNEVVAVCFAKVHAEECKFSGLAQEEGIPNITPFEKLKSNSPFKAFDTLPALISHWRSSLENIAEEIRAGHAGVIFEDENDLMYCDVKPLLRLPERQLQFEMQRMEASAKGAGNA